MHSTPSGLGSAVPPHIESMVVQDMTDLGVDAAFIYAFQHTGLLVTDATIDSYSTVELVAWQDALERYRRLKTAA